MPELKRYIEIRAFYTPENAKRHEKTPSSELRKTKRESGLEDVYYADTLEEAIKKTEQLLIGFKLSVNFVLLEVDAPIYTSNPAAVRQFFLL